MDRSPALMVGGRMSSLHVFMKIISIILFALALCTGSPSPQHTSNAVMTGPNVIMIVADDLGRYDLSVYGNPVIETPRLQEMADGGITFAHAYVAQPICSPSRAAIQTGLHPARTALTEHIRGIPPVNPCWPVIPPKSMQRMAYAYETIGEAMQARDYQTIYVGKWHLGGGQYKPDRHGYDISLAGGGRGLPDSFFPPYFGGSLFPELQEMAPDDNYLTDALTTLALKSMPTDTSERFFLALNYYSPHVPIEGPPDLVEKYEAILGGNADTLPRPHYAAMVERIDQQVGRLIDSLSARGILDNTVILFTSDHGALTVEEVPAFAEHTPPTTSGEYRAGKGYLYDGGLRVPLIAYAPGILAPQIDSFYTVNTDWYSTITHLTDVPGTSLDGVAIPSLTGAPEVERQLYWHYPHYSPQRGNPAGVIIDPPYKLIQWYSDVDSVRLHNLALDPGEEINLADDMPDLRDQLLTDLATWRETVKAREMVPNPDYNPENCR